MGLAELGPCDICIVGRRAPGPSDGFASEQIATSAVFLDARWGAKPGTRLTVDVYEPPSGGREIEPNPPGVSIHTRACVRIDAPSETIDVPEPPYSAQDVARDVGCVAGFTLGLPIAIAGDVVTAPFQLWVLLIIRDLKNMRGHC
jgi:hypothetical protein